MALQRSDLTDIVSSINGKVASKVLQNKIWFLKEQGATIRGLILEVYNLARAEGFEPHEARSLIISNLGEIKYNTLIKALPLEAKQGNIKSDLAAHRQWARVENVRDYGFEEGEYDKLMEEQKSHFATPEELKVIPAMVTITKEFAIENNLGAKFIALMNDDDMDSINLFYNRISHEVNNVELIKVENEV